MTENNRFLLPGAKHIDPIRLEEYFFDMSSRIRERPGMQLSRNRQSILVASPIFGFPKDILYEVIPRVFQDGLLKVRLPLTLSLDPETMALGSVLFTIGAHHFSGNRERRHRIAHPASGKDTESGIDYLLRAREAKASLTTLGRREAAILINYT